MIAPGHISSLEEYYRLRQQRLDRDEEKPYAAMFLLADSTTLFWQEQGMDWVTRIRCEIPTRALRYDGSEAHVHASYIGCASGDNPEYYEIFVLAMAQIGIKSCMHILADPTRRQRRHLEQSDIVLIGGGDVKRGWEKLENTFLGESIKWRYYAGAVIIGVAEGATLLGSKVFYRHGDEWIFSKGLNLMNVCVSCNDPDDFINHKLVKKAGPGTVLLGLPKMSGVIFNTDGAFEPVRKAVTEIHYHYENPEPHAHYVFPPERGEGILVHVEAFRIRREKARREGGERPSMVANDESTDEDDDNDDCPNIAESDGVKKVGNEAFVRGDFAAALVLYQQAQLSNRTSCVLWTNIAATLLKLHQPKESVSAATMGLCCSHGRSAKAWFRRAEAFGVLGEGREAAADSEEARALAPTDPDVIALCAANPIIPSSLTLGPSQRLRALGLREALRSGPLTEDMTSLDLTGNAIRDSGVRLLCASGVIRQLETLILKSNGITDDVAECLCEHIKDNTMPGMRHLDLSHNFLGFPAVRCLATLLRTPGVVLETLALQGNQIGSDAIARLTAVGVGHPTLRLIDARGVRVAKSVQNQFADQCKYEKCQILVGGFEEGYVVPDFMPY